MEKFNVGTDIVCISRLANTIAKMPTFIKKIYTDQELALAQEIKNPMNFYATRFAAKEAIMKATNLELEFREIEILKGSNGEPLAKLINHAEYELKISVSYDTDYAIAFCLAIKK